MPLEVPPWRPHAYIAQSILPASPGLRLEWLDFVKQFVLLYEYLQCDLLVVSNILLGELSTYLKKDKEDRSRAVLLHPLHPPADGYLLRTSNTKHQVLFGPAPSPSGQPAAEYTHQEGGRALSSEASKGGSRLAWAHIYSVPGGSIQQ